LTLQFILQHITKVTQQKEDIFLRRKLLP